MQKSCETLELKYAELFAFVYILLYLNCDKEISTHPKTFQYCFRSTLDSIKTTYTAVDPFISIETNLQETIK